MGNNYVTPDHTRSKDQRQVYKQILAQGLCPFCHEHLSEFHKKPILYNGDYWVLTESQWPRESAKHHFMIIHKDHIENVEDLSLGAWFELNVIVKRLVTSLEIKGYGFVIRSGLSHLSGGSVRHLHAHLVVPEKGKKVRFGFGTEVDTTTKEV
jgi:ATP adenylyltransferase